MKVSVGLLCCLFVSCLAGETVRGVQPSNAEFYLGTKVFRCLDGSVEIPFSHVNDEYCDCPDGSDEPGTPGCSYLSKSNPKWLFHCSDTKFTSKEILHSHVNDGICDCCDGSDEYSSGAICANTCAEAFEKAEREREAREATRLLGLKAKEGLILEAQTKRVQLLSKLEEEQKKVSSLEIEVTAAEDEKTATELLENAERQRIKENSEQEFAKWKATQEEKKKIEEANPPPPENSNIICSKWRQTQDCVSSGERQPDSDKECDVTIPDGWSGFCDCVDPESGAEIRHDFDCGHKPLTCAYVCSHDGAEPDIIESKVEEEFKVDDGSKFELPGAVQARQDVRDKRRALEESQRRVKEIESDLARNFGPQDVLLPLKDKCFELHLREYTYKLCPFVDVQQMKKGSTFGPVMGRWKGFGEQSYSSWGSQQDYTHMMFTDGEQCWGGPQRSTDVHVVCGAESSLLSVEEPSMCKYKMVFQTPAVCE